MTTANKNGATLKIIISTLIGMIAIIITIFSVITKGTYSFAEHETRENKKAIRKNTDDITANKVVIERATTTLHNVENRQIEQVTEIKEVKKGINEIILRLPK